MKIIYIIIALLILSTGVLFSSESEQAYLEMKDNMSVAFHNMSDELASIELNMEGDKLFHDETVIAITPELGIKVPGLVGLSFTLGVEYTFKRKLPAGYAYDKP
jgi:hypothetical protein